MDSVLFGEWVRDVNKKFQAEGRKAALIIDSFLVHPIIENWSHIRLVILPSNTTSVSQSMDQSVVRYFKAHYRKRLIQLILRSLDSNKPLRKVSLLIPSQLLVSGWNKVSQTANVNCFKKSKISEKDQTIVINDEDDSLKEINKNLEKLR